MFTRVLVTLCAVTILLFNNCGQQEAVSFKALTEQEFLYQCAEDVNFSEDCPYVFRETFKRNYETAPTDVLFILDDSCSMSVIASSMASGFSSLQAVEYADNTQVGLTYMQPAYVNGDGSLDLSRAYHPKAYSDSPGFMDLISQSRVESFVANNTQFVDDYPMELCQEDWFSPSQKSSSGDFCLDAAAQLSHICTGVEAGFVALKHLLAKKTRDGQSLFRKQAIVNLVLVSDTHEPGMNYFGQEGAEEDMDSFEELLSEINKNSPEIASLKISGILPLPVVGDPVYTGLKTVGLIPQNESEAKINAEEFWDYSYLPYIKATDGVVAHAKTEDWSQLAKRFVEESQVIGNLVVQTEKTPQKIRFVMVNGNVLNEQDWSIGSDGSVITIKYQSQRDEELDIDVVYEIPADEHDQL